MTPSPHRSDLEGPTPSGRGASGDAPSSGFKRLAALPARLAEILIWIYQKLVSPALAVAAPSCGCRFAPTCSHYAREALREHGLFAGLALTFRRLAKCAPWHPGGLDPVPPRRRPVCARVTHA